MAGKRKQKNNFFELGIRFKRRKTVRRKIQLLEFVCPFCKATRLKGSRTSCYPGFYPEDLDYYNPNNNIVNNDLEHIYDPHCLNCFACIILQRKISRETEVSFQRDSILDSNHQIHYSDKNYTITTKNNNPYLFCTKCKTSLLYKAMFLTFSTQNILKEYDVRAPQVCSCLSKTEKWQEESEENLY